MLYLNDGAAPRRTLDPAAPDPSENGAAWLDLLNPTDAERDAAHRITGLRIPLREEVAEIESSSRLYREGEAIYLSMPYSFLAADGHSESTPMGFVLSKRHMLTIRFVSLPAVESFAEHHGHDGPAGSAATFVGLAEAIVDRVADVLERVAADLTALSKAVFSDAPSRSQRQADRDLRSLLNQVGRNGDTLGNLRDSVLGLGRIAAYTLQSCDGWLPPELKARLVTLKADVGSLNDYDQQLSNKVSFLLDAVLGFINIEQNNTVKVLTIASAVGIPPTFVVGLYGMNFKNMPEYDWAHGYAFGWAMILVSIIVPIIFLRWRGFI